MKWYYHIAGGHTHVRVFMNGAKCGDLCFQNDEFEQIRRTGGLHTPISEFIDGTPFAVTEQTMHDLLVKPHLL